MKKFFFLAAVFIYLNTFGQNGTEKFSGNQIITSENISSAGVSRLSDIYFLLDNWNTVTIDGFRWQIFSSMVPFDQSQNWILMLDGQKLDINFFDMKNINLLPIASWKIDSIETISSQGLYKGEYADYGLINISTKKPAKGFSFFSQIYVGNEEGDPGPYKYVKKYYSENIDIIGPDYAMGLEFGSDPINISLNYKTNAQIYPTSDTPISYRLTDYEFKYRKVFTDALSILIDLPAIFGKPKLIASYSGTGKYAMISSYGSDLIYYAPLSHEVPVDNKFGYIGLSGIIDFDAASSLNYAFNWSSNKLKNPKEISEYMIDWQINNYYFKTEFNRSGNNLDYTIGAGVNHYIATAPYSLADNTVDHYTIYGSMNFAVNENIKQSAELMLLYNGKNSAIKSSAVNKIKINDYNVLESKISFSNQFFDEYNNIWYWVTKGYKLPTDYSMEANNADNISTNISLDVKWNYFPLDGIKIQFGSFVNHFYNMIYENKQIEYNPDEKTISSNSIIETGISGNTYGISVKAHHKISGKFSHSLFYMYSAETGSEKLFTAFHDIFHEHKLNYKAQYSPDDNFGINLSVTFLSPSKWSNFNDIEMESGGIYKAKQGSRLLCDAVILKWFWEKRFKVNMTFKNIFSYENRYTPIGAHFDFCFFLQAELAIW